LHSSLFILHSNLSLRWAFESPPWCCSWLYSGIIRPRHLLKPSTMFTICETRETNYLYNGALCEAHHPSLQQDLINAHPSDSTIVKEVFAYWREKTVADCTAK
ncbi:hypothetical protein PFISCL1PPCAC_12040, partial [Pristionchus fissidentatus]